MTVRVSVTVKTGDNDALDDACRLMELLREAVADLGGRVRVRGVAMSVEIEGVDDSTAQLLVDAMNTKGNP